MLNFSRSTTQGNSVLTSADLLNQTKGIGTKTTPNF